MSESKERKDYWEGKRLLAAQVDDELYAKVVDFAATYGIPVSNAVRFIIINYLRNERK